MAREIFYLASLIFVCYLTIVWIFAYFLHIDIDPFRNVFAEQYFIYDEETESTFIISINNDSGIFNIYQVADDELLDIIVKKELVK